MPAGIAAVVSALEAKGFAYADRTSDGWVLLNGHLQAADKSLRCELALDPEGAELPRIRLLELPQGAPKVNPHLGSEGHFCYIAKGTVVLDLFDPVGQTLACLDKASEVLDAVLKGELYKDLEEEFFAYWQGVPCLVDMPGKQYGRQKTLIVEQGGRLIPVITDDESRTRKKLDALRWKVDAERTFLSYKVRTRAKPRPLTLGRWPPSTVSDVLNWQGLLDPGCRKSIEKRLLKSLSVGAKGAAVLVESPLLTYGFVAIYNRDNEKARKGLTPRMRLARCDVVPLSVTRIDDRYLAARNSPDREGLTGKKIAIVGCGTIGGFLADMLIKSGAGSGGGELTLVDYDSLSPGNVGRHRLGFNSLFKNKALELASEFARVAPTTNIRPLPVDVRKASLGNPDLIIDATGEESLGHWLTSKHLRSTPILTVWIEGPGTAVRGLLKASDEGACFRCIWHAAKKGELLSVEGGVPTLLAGQGCEGVYVPFSASVSVQAAALGAEIIADWADGVLSPALRTRVLDPRYVLATPDSDPPKVEDCSVCAS